MPEDYYRGDQAAGITPPNPDRVCTPEEHIVRARGKKSQYTSVSLKAGRVRDFGDTLYQLDRAKFDVSDHDLVVHKDLLDYLQHQIENEEREVRLLAIHALRRAKKRLEGLIDWKFRFPSSVKRKDRISWVEPRIQEFFTRL